MEFHDDYPQYELMYHHDEETGKKVRRKLWNVFWVLLAVTIIELVVGFKATSWGLTGTTFLKLFFIFFTIVKAGGIVMYFMHLIDETKFFKYTILVPYSVFIVYLIFIILVEGTYCGYPENKTNLKPMFGLQQLEKRQHHGQPIPESLKKLEGGEGAVTSEKPAHHE